MGKEFLEAIKARRTFYAINNEKIVPEEKIRQIVQDAVLNSPSAFNSQGSRVVLLFGKEHEKLWDITADTLRPIVPAESFPSTQQKLNSFRSGYGTLLFYEDQDTIAGLQEKFALYKENFPVWALESNGMLQLIIWTALEAEGLGVSLQHYNPLIDEKVRAAWNIPKGWNLLGQMPFGKPVAPPDTKSFLPLEDRIRIF